MSKEEMKRTYSVKELALLAGVSIRTLHLYDKTGLLKPRERTASRYRLYGEAELFRLQQILFYKELDMPLKEIRTILDDPAFDLISALENHRAALMQRRDRMSTLLQTIDNTVIHLKNKTTMNFEQLYNGLPKEQAVAMHREAVDKWGAEVVERSEQTLLNMPAGSREELKTGLQNVLTQMRNLFPNGETAESSAAQKFVKDHYIAICGFWGVSPYNGISMEQYKGLAELYVTDDRYIITDGKADPDFAAFLRNAMIFYADNVLK